MSYTVKERRTNTKKQVRDEDGHFIPQEDIKIETKTQTPFPPKEDTKKSSSDEPLVSLQVHNPFKKLLKWLDYIRKHQTTTFNFKINIPLIALPVFIAVTMGILQGFFSLGKYSQKKETETMPTPTPIVIVEPTIAPVPIAISKLGTITATYQEEEGREEEEGASPIPAISRYILVDNDDRVTFLIIPQSIPMERYINRRVLVTGMYDVEHLALTIDDPSDLEIIW